MENALIRSFIIKISDSSLPCELRIFMNFCKEDLLVNIFKFTEGILISTACQSEDMANFHNFQSKLELVTLSLVHTILAFLSPHRNVDSGVTNFFEF